MRGASRIKYYRGAEFFKTDVKNVYFAALTLATGEAGAASLRSVGGGRVRVRCAARGVR